MTAAAVGVRPRIRLIASGGTISSAKALDGLAVPVHGAAEILGLVPTLTDYASVASEDYSRTLSSQLSLGDVHGLARRIAAALAEDPDLEGVVVTHGTGTMEESAFIADLVVDDDRPVVFTGAMLGGASELSDGPLNVLNAVRVATSGAAPGRGVLVVMNGVVHSARDARKAHTARADAFTSGEPGPVGHVYSDRVHFTQAPRIRGRPFRAAPVFDVDLIKFAIGMDDRYVRASVAGGAAGIVIEGSGLGNVNDALADGIESAIAHGTTVALCSRAGDGRVFPSYGTRAAAGGLAKLGCLFCSLPGPKARILLMFALGETRDTEELQRLLDPSPA